MKKEKLGKIVVMLLLMIALLKLLIGSPISTTWLVLFISWLAIANGRSINRKSSRNRQCSLNTQFYTGMDRIPYQFFYTKNTSCNVLQEVLIGIFRSVNDHPNFNEINFPIHAEGQQLVAISPFSCLSILDLIDTFKEGHKLIMRIGNINPRYALLSSRMRRIDLQ